MLPDLRRRFLENFSQADFRRVLTLVESASGGAIPFRIAESPIFLPRELLREMSRAGEEIVARALAVPGYADEVARRVPAGVLIPDSGEPHPEFVQCDFALTLDPEGNVHPMLIEMQGFPSLYAFHHALSQAFVEVFHLGGVSSLGEGVDEREFLTMLREAIFGRHDPELVALVDVHPWQQGTWPDFRLTQRLFPGLAVVSVTDIRQRGRRLYHVQDGREVPLARIFNRVIWEELKALGTELSFDPREALDVEWAPHPNWFFKLSKLSLPFVPHANVPVTHFLDRAPGGLDLGRFVLKPLFSFSGRGLTLDLDAATLAAIPVAERSGYVLQEKIVYGDVMEVPGARVRCEVRLMYLWGERPRCVLAMPRMSRGRLMGCAFNTTDPWTGHGVAFWPTGSEAS